MSLKISPKKFWEENLSIAIISLGFIELLTEQIHELLKWPMIGLSLFSLVLCFANHKLKAKTIMLMVTVVGLAVVELNFSEGILATQYIWDIGICMPVALCIYYAKKVNLKKWIILYIVVAVFLLSRLLMSEDYYTIFYSHSRNYISIFLIFLMFLTSIIAYKSNTRIPNWMYYSTAAICIISIGRGGVLAGLLILALHIIDEIHEEKRGEQKRTKILFLIICILITFVFFVFLQEYIIQIFFPRFSHSGSYSNYSDSAVNKRLLMWGTYLDQCLYSLKLFFLGTNPVPIVLRIHYRYDYNLHNSFLMTHVFYGIIAFIGIIILSIRFIKQFKNENRMDIIIIYIGFLIRSFTDHLFPGKLSAIAIWVAIIYGVNLNKKKMPKGGTKHEQNLRVPRF